MEAELGSTPDVHTKPHNWPADHRRRHRHTHTHYLLQTCVRSHPETPQYSWANGGTLKESWNGLGGSALVAWETTCVATVTVPSIYTCTLSGLKPLAPPWMSLFGVQMLNETSKSPWLIGNLLDVSFFLGGRPQATESSETRLWFQGGFSQRGWATLFSHCLALASRFKFRWIR